MYSALVELMQPEIDEAVDKRINEAVNEAVKKTWDEATNEVTSKVTAKNKLEAIENLIKYDEGRGMRFYGYNVRTV